MAGGWPCGADRGLLILRPNTYPLRDMASLSSDVSNLLLAYDPDFVELETAPLLLDDISLQGAIPAVLGGADSQLSEEICPEGRYEDFIANLRAFLREKKIGGGFDWGAVVITGPELFSTRPSSHDRVEADEESATRSDEPEAVVDEFRDEFDSEDDGEDEAFWGSGRASEPYARSQFPTRRSTHGGASNTKNEIHAAEDAEPASTSIGGFIVELESTGPGGMGKALGALSGGLHPPKFHPPAPVAQSPSPDEAAELAYEEILGAMDDTEAEPLASTTGSAFAAKDPGWGSTPAQATSLLQYIVPAASFAEGSLSLPE